MRCVLYWKGPLPSNGDRKTKHEIRVKFHHQLEQLWELEPALKERRDGFKGAGVDVTGIAVPKAEPVTVNGQKYLPLVVGSLRLVAFIDVSLSLRRWPDVLMRPGGDLDNRLKTLLDALRVPDENQARGIVADSSTIYTLLEDDNHLVSGLQVRTEQLLDPPDGDECEQLHYVRVKITAVVRPTVVTADNLTFLGGFIESS